MFTGIVEALGTVSEIISVANNVELTLHTPLAAQLSIDQSVAHDGICLTVVAQSQASYKVIAIDETLQKTTLRSWQVGKQVNLERAMTLGNRLDGHMVQGHVDGVSPLVSLKNAEGSYVLTFLLPPEKALLVMEKGSICLNGVSLTCFDVREDRFSVALIPYTWQHTNLQYLQEGDTVNIEYDMMGKYFARWVELQARNNKP